MESDSATKAHACASAMITVFFTDAMDRKLNLESTLYALKTFLTMAVLCVSKKVEPEHIGSLAKEILDSMTSMAMIRVNDYVEKYPPS